jgi:hypothetical protein
MSSSAISILIFSLFWAQFLFMFLNSVRLRLLSFFLQADGRKIKGASYSFLAFKPNSTNNWTKAFEMANLNRRLTCLNVFDIDLYKSFKVDCCSMEFRYQYLLQNSTASLTVYPKSIAPSFVYLMAFFN